MKTVRLLTIAAAVAMMASAAEAQSPDATGDSAAAAKPGVVILNPTKPEAEQPAAKAEPSATEIPAEAAPAAPKAAEAPVPADQPETSDTATAQVPDADIEADKLEGRAEDAAMNEAAELSRKAEEAEKPIAKIPEPPSLEIDINLSTQRMTVFEGTSPVHSWPISSGRYGYKTPTGSFKPIWMTKMWHSRQYDNAPMPHSIFFHGGVAIHATYATRMLGRPASHGCVRLAPSNAKALFALVKRHGKERTKITVHGKPNYGPQVASRRQRNYYVSQWGYEAAPQYYYDQRALKRYYRTAQRGYSNYGRAASRGIFGGY